jgi:Glycosyltransferase family 87
MPTAKEAQMRDRTAWFLVLVAAVATFVVLVGLKEEAVGFDLATVYVRAAEDVRDGVSPFPEPDDPVFRGHQAYVYPPLTAFLAMPFTLLSSPVLEYAGVLSALAILLLALAVVGVRDPRCYAVFVLWPPTMTTWQNANVSALLVLACALTWRFRDTVWREGAALGLGIALKLLLWPLAVWLLATRRIRAFLATAVVAAAAIIVPWAAIGFKGFLDYPDLLRMLTEIEGENSHSVSLYSAVIAAGGPSTLGYLVSVAVGVALLAGVVAFARRGDDRASFFLGLLAALALTPLVWLHYLAALAVPLALYRPRLSGLWLAPLLFWVIAIPSWPFEPRRLVAAVVVGLFTVVLIGRSPASRRGSTPHPYRPVPEVIR